MGDNDKKFEGAEAKDVIENCEKLSAKAIEISTIILNSFIFALLFADLIIIKWSDFTKTTKRVLTLFIIIFLISIVLLIFSILLRYWRAKNLIKKEKKNTGRIIAFLGIILSFALIVFSNLDSIFFENSLIYLIEPCEKKAPILYPNGYPYNLKQNNLYNSTIINKDIRRKLEICPIGQDYIKNVRLVDEIMMKVTFAILEYFYSILFGFFIILLTRIKDGIDGPEKEKNFIVQNVESLRISIERGQSNIIEYLNKNNREKKNEIQNRNILAINKVESIDTQERNLNK